MSYNAVVIMAGGVGTRLWPFSRTNHPKQFHDLLGSGQTLLQATVDRFHGIADISQVYIVTNYIYKDIIKNQLPGLPDENILCEPLRKNTAPCIAYAAYKIALKHPQANMVVAPADHIIKKKLHFQDTLRKALNETSQFDKLLTLGIKPTRPDTGYGYIQFKEEEEGEIKKVKTFTEKPKLEEAIKFLDSGDFLWNAGIFVWNVQSIIQAFEMYLDDMAEIFKEAQKDFYTPAEEDSIKKAYYVCKNISIDVGIMEKASNVYVIPSDFDWSDLGTWKSIYEISEKDAHQNVITGKVMAYETNGCIIKTPEDKLVVVQGLSNYIIAESDNVLLVCRKDEEQKVRDFVADAKNKGNHYV